MKKLILTILLTLPFIVNAQSVQTKTEVKTKVTQTTNVEKNTIKAETKAPVKSDYSTETDYSEAKKAWVDRNKKTYQTIIENDN